MKFWLVYTINCIRIVFGLDNHIQYQIKCRFLASGKILIAKIFCRSLRKIEVTVLQWIANR